MMLGNWAITESREPLDLKFDVFETINQSNFEVSLMEYFHHSQGVTTDIKRLTKIRVVILGKRVRVCASNFPRVI
jgi:hypothetical protein